MNINKIQNLWMYHKYHKMMYIIVKNIKILVNHQDPISLNVIYQNGKIFDIKNLYAIFRNNRMYLYELSSLKDMVNNNNLEIHTNTEFTLNELNEIKFLTSKIKKKEIEYTKEQKFYFIKSHIFTIFHELETYFSIQMYENIEKQNLQTILNELKLMWEAFCKDNGLNEIELFGTKLKWNMRDKEIQLLTNIKIMIDNDLDKSFKKAICYVIIGAFAYVDKDVKKLYKDIEFV